MGTHGGWIDDPAGHSCIGPADMVRAIFRDSLSTSRRCVVWSKGQGAAWCSSPEGVAEAAAQLDAQGDVYFGACLQAAEAERSRSRGATDTTTAMGGVWVDLDITGPGHAGVRYPPSVEDALELLERRIEQRPSIVLVTGGGLHLWWLLDEPLLVASEADRRSASALVERWQAWVRMVLAEKRWVLDTTHDLARVMRLPRTSNHKYTPSIPARVATWEVA